MMCFHAILFHIEWSTAEHVESHLRLARARVVDDTDIRRVALQPAHHVGRPSFSTGVRRSQREVRVVKC